MRRKKKRDGNKLIDDNKPKNAQKQSEYEPLKTGVFELDLQEGWRNLISCLHYDLFVTLTFLEEIEHWKAKIRFEKWLGSLNCDLFGWRYKRKGLGIWGAVVYENQKRGILHLHALLGAEGLKELDREYMAKLWVTNGQRNLKTGTLIDRIVNGIAKIEPYDPARGAIRYMSKHISKEAEPIIIVPRREKKKKKP